MAIWQQHECGNEHYKARIQRVWMGPNHESKLDDGIFLIVVSLVQIVRGRPALPHSDRARNAQHLDDNAAHFSIWHAACYIDARTRICRRVFEIQCRMVLQPTLGIGDRRDAPPANRWPSTKLDEEVPPKQLRQEHDGRTACMMDDGRACGSCSCDSTQAPCLVVLMRRPGSAPLWQWCQNLGYSSLDI